MAKILIVDDEQHMRKALKHLLELDGYEVQTADNGLSALELFKSDHIDLVLTDIRMPKMNGLQLLREIHQINPLIPVIVMTAFAKIEDAIQSMKDGASHYLMKPFDNELVKLEIHKAIDEKSIRTELLYFRDELNRQYSYHNIIGKSIPMLEVFELIRRVASSKSTVLITGESGTGKELVARAIHSASPRKDKPMIKVNCIAIPDQLLESELFGHIRGAFTDAIQTRPGKFELANLSTIFLDEIGDMSLQLQGKILRVLQEREFEPVGSSTVRKVDVRIIAATNRTLKQLVKEGRFREDLYFRLNVLPIHLPPLRERKEDIPELIKYFLNKYKNELGKNIDSITLPALSLLKTYDYPGNVRELENLIERAVVLTTNNQLDINDFQLNLHHRYQLKPELTDSTEFLTYRDAKRTILENFEQNYFRSALELMDGNVSRAAELTGMHRKNFYEKLNQYMINTQDFIKK